MQCASVTLHTDKFFQVTRIFMACPIDLHFTTSNKHNVALRCNGFRFLLEVITHAALLWKILMEQINWYVGVSKMTTRHMSCIQEPQQASQQWACLCRSVLSCCFCCGHSISIGSSTCLRTNGEESRLLKPYGLTSEQKLKTIGQLVSIQSLERTVACLDDEKTSPRISIWTTSSRYYTWTPIDRYHRARDFLVCDKHQKLRTLGMWA